ncbi:MAG TPA: hypothetical protein VN370_02055 [Desulfitobacteriaceae bacterium]|jgi:hypothetical protein|nr:hypothetical protein [Desulfitobacteriaceae bacterium]
MANQYEFPVDSVFGYPVANRPNVPIHGWLGKRAGGDIGQGSNLSRICFPFTVRLI